MRWIPGIFWIVQLPLCALASLLQRQSYYFVRPMGSARDLADFIHAATLLQAHRDPYTDPRFVTPPLSLCVGIAAHAAKSYAAPLFLAANVLFILSAVWLLGRRFAVPFSYRVFLLFSAFSFYPVIFLLNRENIDGILLLLFCLSLVSRRAWVQGTALALGNNLKLYTLVPSCYKLWKEGGRGAAWLIVALTVLFSLPGIFWDHSFMHNLATRAALATGTENLSPGLFLGSLLRNKLVKACYAAVWLFSLAAAAYRLRSRQESRAAVWLTPWMLALPFQVYPYSGVLLLCPMVEWFSSAPGEQEVQPKLKDWLVAVGFCMAGVQQQALTDLFRNVVHSHRFFPFFNALGVVLLAVSVFAGNENKAATPRLHG